MKDAVPRAILRHIGIADGFVLVPVEVPGGDHAERLARWMAQHGRRLGVLDLRGGADTRLGPAILAAATPEGTFVIGPDAPGDPFQRSLGLLNRHRDRVSTGLSAPLLWCGTPAWLAATWEHAPDFWSVRALTFRLVPGTTPVADGAPWNGPLVDDPPERLAALRDEARRQGDASNAARMGYLHGAALASRSRFEEARGALVDALAEVPPDQADLAFDLAFLDARLAVLTGAADAARMLDRARQTAGSSGGRALQIELLVAHISTQAGDLAGAAARLRELLTESAEARPFLEARAWSALGRIERRLGNLPAARTALDRALALFQSQGEALGEANVLVELADVARTDGRSDEARAMLEGALVTYRRHDTADGVARALLRRGVIAAESGEFALASTDLLAAGRIFRAHRLDSEARLARTLRARVARAARASSRNRTP